MRSLRSHLSGGQEPTIPSAMSDAVGQLVVRLPLVGRLHVDLCRQSSACCRL
ncbi:putative leader peptide [Streptomyces sp. NPDC007983]|uniref:putative leader peptide n=1 Tax=Streptomyces sp. NPDC007983 TaxID=3364800 RepID=UPI0036EC1C96